jgi:hypothetical protein
MLLYFATKFPKYTVPSRRVFYRPMIRYISARILTLVEWRRQSRIWKCTLGVVLQNKFSLRLMPMCYRIKISELCTNIRKTKHVYQYFWIPKTFIQVYIKEKNILRHVCKVSRSLLFGLGAGGAFHNAQKSTNTTWAGNLECQNKDRITLLGLFNDAVIILGLKEHRMTPDKMDNNARLSSRSGGGRGRKKHSWPI